MSEVDRADDFLRGDIDDDKLAAVRARLTHAGVTVDGCVSQAAIGRSDEFMHSDAALGD